MNATAAKNEESDTRTADEAALIDDLVWLYGPDLILAFLNVFKGSETPDLYERLERLRDPTMKPLPPNVPAPVVARNPTEARLFKLEFKEQARARKEKAAALYDVLAKRCTTPALTERVLGCDFVACSNGDVIAIKSKKAWQLCAAWGIPNYIATGLTVATVGTWDRPCVRGLAGLEALLRKVPKFEGPHRDL